MAGERARVAELMSSSESSLAATSAAVERQLEAAREELAAAKSRASDLASQLEKAEKAKRAADDKARKDITDLQVIFILLAFCFVFSHPFSIIKFNLAIKITK